MTLFLAIPQIYHCEEHNVHFSLRNFWQEENWFLLSLRADFEKFHRERAFNSYFFTEQIVLHL